MTSTDIQNLIVSTATGYGIDPRLALEVAITESGLNQSAVSPAGAIGIFQLEPATAADLGVDPTDPAQNIEGGVRYLAQLVNQFGGDVSQALGAYNWGMGHVQAAVASYGSAWLNYAPSETQSYVAKILGAMGTEYDISAGGDTGTILPGFSAATAGTPLQSGIGSGISFTAIAVLVGAGLFLMWTMGD